MATVEQLEAAFDAARQAVDVTAALGDRFACSHCHLFLGEALFLTGRKEEAVTAYREAERLILSTGTVATTLDPATRLAELALATGKAVEAKRLLAPVLAAERVAIETSLDPLRVEFTVFTVLHALGEPGASDWLRAAHERLQTQAEGLTDDTLRSKLLGLARHRAVLEAYATQYPAARST